MRQRKEVQRTLNLVRKKGRASVIKVFHSTWITSKINGVATDLFCTGVIGHPGGVFLSQGPRSLIENNITGLRNIFEILSLGVQLRVSKD